MKLNLLNVKLLLAGFAVVGVFSVICCSKSSNDGSTSFSYVDANSQKNQGAVLIESLVVTQDTSSKIYSKYQLSSSDYCVQLVQMGSKQVVQVTKPRKGELYVSCSSTYLSDGEVANTFSLVKAFEGAYHIQTDDGKQLGFVVTNATSDGKLVKNIDDFCTGHYESACSFGTNDWTASDQSHTKIFTGIQVN